MRIATLSDRAVLLGTGVALDISAASDGRFDSHPGTAYERWEEFRRWADTIAIEEHPLAAPFDVADLGPPVPRPRQIFAIGLNYAAHAEETKLGTSADPVVFTKFASALTGPDVVVALSSDSVDWEAELVVVIGTGGRSIAPADSWDHIAGFTVGQDLSDRTVQMWGPPAQFSLGKSFEGYAPVGPSVVTLDEVSASHDREDLRISCRVEDGETGEVRVLQDGRTSQMLFTIPVLVSRLSGIVELYPGDLVFTGTPAGVGMGRAPVEFLKAGQVLITQIEGVGELRQRFVA